MKREMILIALGCAIAGAAYAASPADVIKARQQNYKSIGKAFKAIMDENKKSDPSLDVLKTNAATIAGLGRHIPSWFPKGSGPEAGVKTGALPVIWEKPDEFRQRAATLVGYARGLQDAAGKGDSAKARAYVPALGGACKGCHDTFRARQS